MEVDNHILEYISLYLDDELQNGERLAVETHIKSCADCRAALEAERELISAIRSAHPVYTAPAALVPPQRCSWPKKLRKANQICLFTADHCGLRSYAACARGFLAGCAKLSPRRPQLVCYHGRQ